MKVTPPKPVTRGSPVADVIEGFRFVVTHAPIHHLMILLGIVSVTGMPFAVLMPIFADQILHGGAKGLGILMGASGVGALAGGLAAGLAPNGFRTGALGGDFGGGIRCVAHGTGGFALVLAFVCAACCRWASP